MADGLTLEAPDFGPLMGAVQRAGLDVQAVIGAALYEAMLDVMDDAKDLCPVKTGALRDSGRVNRARVSSGTVTIALDFGVDPQLDYAEEQHENLTLGHAPGKQAKFLEQPLLEWASTGGPAEVIQDASDFLEKSIG